MATQPIRPGDRVKIQSGPHKDRVGTVIEAKGGFFPFALVELDTDNKKLAIEKSNLYVWQQQSLFA